MAATEQEKIRNEGETHAESRPCFFSFSLRASRLLAALAFAACVPTWLGLFARAWWPFELATHFTWHYAVVLPVFALLMWFANRRRLLGVTLLTALINLWQIAPYYPPVNWLNEKPATTPSGPLRVMTLNVLTSNNQYEKSLKLIAEQQPDVLLLLEIDSSWVAELEALKAVYPHHWIESREDNFGIAMYSRLPTDSITPLAIGNADVPSVRAKLIWNGNLLNIIGTHPLPPTSAALAKLRNEQLAAVAEVVGKQTAATVVMGDLNITPYSPYFVDLLRASKLQDSAAGHPVRGTWSSRSWLLAIPIDHILHSASLVVQQREIGPDVGSDHRAVMVDFLPAMSP